MEKIIVCIGGGEIRTKQTLEIDRFLAELAKRHAGEEKRPLALFVGTASHDSLPYYNSFHKTYTGEFGLKTDVALSFKGTMDAEKTAAKFLAADLVYVGGGDTKFMLETWEKNGFWEHIKAAYERGVPIAGLSAGAICWFDEMYTDSEILEGNSTSYKLMPAMGILEGTACPHYDERQTDFDEAILSGKSKKAYAFENLSAEVFEGGVPVKTISAGGSVYALENKNGEILKKRL